MHTPHSKLYIGNGLLFPMALWIQTPPEKVLNHPNQTPAPLPKKVLGPMRIVCLLFWL